MQQINNLRLIIKQKLIRSLSVPAELKGTEDFVDIVETALGKFTPIYRLGAWGSKRTPKGKRVRQCQRK
jgi:hypothetical protein